jgi:hypothetical protein
VISVDFSDSVQRKDVTTEILERKDKNWLDCRVLYIAYQSYNLGQENSAGFLKGVIIP